MKTPASQQAGSSAPIFCYSSPSMMGEMGQHFSGLQREFIKTRQPRMLGLHKNHVC